jgi:hypothetical protein
MKRVMLAMGMGKNHQVDSPDSRPAQEGQDDSRPGPFGVGDGAAAVFEFTAGVDQNDVVVGCADNGSVGLPDVEARYLQPVREPNE